MALATKCPQCGSMFRVVADQLKLRGGLVRCGQCRTVFDAIGSLAYVEDVTLSPARPADDAAGEVPPAQPMRAEARAASPRTPTSPAAERASAAAERKRRVLGPATTLRIAPGAAPVATISQSLPLKPASVAAAQASPSSLHSASLAASATGVPTLLATDAAYQLDDVEGAALDGIEVIEMPAAEPAVEPMIEPASERDEPAFVRAATRAPRAGFSIVFGGGTLLLVLLATAQLAVVFRSEALTRWPATRPALVLVCQAFGCTLGWPTQPDQLAVIGSELQAIPGTDVLELTAVIRNRAGFTQALPALEVTLSDHAKPPSGAQGLHAGRLPVGGARAEFPYRRGPGCRCRHDDSRFLRDTRRPGGGIPRLPLLYIDSLSAPGPERARGGPVRSTHNDLMRTLICGSIAYDTVMVFQGRFADHILPDQVHILNVSFLVPEMKREFGGCAGNIAYSLKCLGGEPVPMATVGDDAGPYLDRLDVLDIDRRHVAQVSGSYTAQAFITTDLNDNQLTAFHPGAMAQSHLNSVPADGGIELGIVAPDGRDGMQQHAQQFAEHGIPFIFDLGQAMPLFNGEELLWFIARATYVTLNDYEARVVVERTRLSLAELAGRVKALVVTRGAEGSDIYVGGSTLHVPVAKARALVDPIGCGDAYRGGLLYGIANKLDWETTGRLAAVMGAIKIEASGAQNYVADRTSIARRFHEAFGYRPW